MFTLILISLILALIPALMFCANLRAYAPPPAPEQGTVLPPVSVLIPARNEETAIGAAVGAVLMSQGLEFEVVVLDDHSQDRTAMIVQELANVDNRVRLISPPVLPAGWCGKQHACWVLAQKARHPLLVFLDADVRLAPNALSRITAFVEATGADLASGIPYQETGSFLEKLVIPLIHFILLGFLLIPWMRRSRLASLSAGCGQLFIAKAIAYQRCGGHAAIRHSLHDGIKLPRAFRASGFKTDLFDATGLASCRMYGTARDVWFGLAKNAGEALAAPALIVPMTVVLLGGQVLPVILLALSLISSPYPFTARQLGLSALATALVYYPRLAASVRFRQDLLGALLHPVGILVLVSIQWFAFVRHALGRPSSWKGRVYPTPASEVCSELLSHGELNPSS
jgi:Glycosyl transferase family 2